MLQFKEGGNKCLSGRTCDVTGGGVGGGSGGSSGGDPSGYNSDAGIHHSKDNVTFCSQGLKYAHIICSFLSFLFHSCVERIYF